MIRLTNPSPKSTLKRYPEGSIFQGFGENKADYALIKDSKGRACWNGHSGWDVLAYKGAPILAVADGQVVNVVLDRVSLGGVTVRIFHPQIGLYSGYGHLDMVNVIEGQLVKAGEQIGTMGNTGLVISGGVKYWGNAPAGKGVHLHLTLAELEEGKAAFSFKIAGKWWRVKNLDNGTWGGIDPTPYFTESIKPETPEITFLQKKIEWLRTIIRAFLKEPVA